MSKFLAIACTCVVVVCTACGGPQNAPAPAGNAAHGVAPAEAFAGGLPALDQLPAPTRRASLSGPGWYGVPLTELTGSSGATLNGASIELAGTAPLAYALYSVWGFDGDSGPTGIKTAVSGVSGDYYLAFSDYKRHSWAFCGPFTGSAEASLPRMDQHASLNDFVSPQGVCHVVVALKPGSALVLNQLELGVHGGAKGPQPPTQFTAQLQGVQARLDWTHSLSAADPDFSGYRIERAPALTGQFEARTSTPTPADYYVDSGLTLGEGYRYRVCSVDASGNPSAWVEGLATPAADGLLGVVAQLDAPRGPLYGPVTVDFDLAGSQALDGQPFTHYQLAIAHGPVYDSPDNPLFSVTLQPGCYTLTATVEGNIPDVTSSDSTTRTLLVLPRWQAAPTVVRAATAPTGQAQTRLRQLRGCVLPGGDAVLLGYDPTMASLGLWRGQPGGAMTLTPLPLANVTVIGEPASLGSQAYFPLASPENVSLVRVGSGQPETVLNIQSADADPGLACVGHGSQVWLLHGAQDMSGLTLEWATLDGLRGVVPGLAPGSAISSLDAVYAPAASAIDIVYSDQDSTEWLRWDPVGNTIVAAANLAAVVNGAIDLELDPATGRPVLAYSNNNAHYYRALDELGVWSAELPLDNTVTNYAPLDLAFDDGVLYACFATWPDGNVRRYKYDAGAWLSVNSVSFSGDDGYQLALLALPGAPGSLLADVDISGTVFLAQLTEDASDAVLWQLGASDGQGFELQACAGSDGLHAVWRSVQENRVRHYLSPDGGATWSDQDPWLALALGARDLDLSSTPEGSVYLSLQDGLSSSLQAWDASAPGFNLRQDFPNSGKQRPYLSHNSDGIVWSAFEDEMSTQHYFAGAIADNPVTLSSTPVWDGVTNNSINVADSPLQFPSLVVQGAWGGGALPRLNLLGFGAAESSFVSFIASPEALLGPAVRGRTLDTTTYSDGRVAAASDTHVAFFATYGAGAAALRYDAGLLADPRLDALEFTTPPGGETRRTLSAALAQGLTGVVLVSSLDGARQLFQWSNFGDWQNIPLPPGLERAFQPELVVGADGRWHILYKDWLTDELKCWSTQ